MASERRSRRRTVKNSGDSAFAAVGAYFDSSSTITRSIGVNQCSEDGSAKQSQRAYGQYMNDFGELFGDGECGPGHGAGEASPMIKDEIRKPLSSLS